MFYEFRQNNSGGVFHLPAIQVFIEADSTDEANRIAERNGLYFDGADDGRDCPCCGDRWYPVSSKWNVHETVPEPSEYETLFAGGDDIPARHIIKKENH